MAADGSKGPKPWTQRRAATTFLRVPISDWPKVRRGYKTEFRATGKDRASQLWHVTPPCPVVAYCIVRGQHQSELMVLEEIWQEPLGAISPESLQREGFESLAEFRQYWMAREHRRFRPTRKAFCYRVRPWIDADREFFAGRFFEHLYGEFAA